MSTKKKTAIIFFTVFILLFTTTLSPSLAIRRDLIFKLQPINSLTVKIQRTDATNNLTNKGSVYFSINKGIDLQTKNDLNGYYLKKRFIFWFITDVGAP